MESLGVRGRRSDAVGTRNPVEAGLGQLHQEEVDDHHGEEQQEELGWQRRKAQEMGQRGVRQDGADQRCAGRDQQHGEARAALEEGYASGPDDVDDQSLGGDGLHEPARLELTVTGVEQREHHPERDEVEDGAHRAEDRHEPSDEGHVPRSWSSQRLGVHPVGRDGQLPGVVEQVVEEDLGGQHREERQEDRGAGRAEHVAEIRRRRHEDVLHGVGEDATPFHHPVGQDPEVLVEQDHVGRVLGHVGARVDRDPDVGMV